MTLSNERNAGSEIDQELTDSKKSVYWGRAIVAIGVAAFVFGAWLIGRFQGSGPVISITEYDEALSKSHAVLFGSQVIKSTIRHAPITEEIKNELFKEGLGPISNELASLRDSLWYYTTNVATGGSRHPVVTGRFHGDAVRVLSSARSLLNGARLSRSKSGYFLTGQSKTSKRTVTYYIMTHEQTHTPNEQHVYFSIR